METVDLENGTADSVGGITGSTLAMDDEEYVHDQLPSVEEYKTHMSGIVTSPKTTDDVKQAGLINDGDDDEEVVHDQLPSVEEVKAATQPQQLSCWRKCCRILGFLLFLVALVAAVVLPIVLIGPNNTFNLKRSSRRADVVDYLVALSISSKTALETPGTPQCDAATWIADDDAFYMPIPPGTNKHNRFVERYALAVFFYATDGPNWHYNLNFLAPMDHCYWSQIFRTSSNALLQLGVYKCEDLTYADANSGGILVTSMFVRKSLLSSSSIDGIIVSDAAKPFS